MRPFLYTLIALILIAPSSLFADEFNAGIVRGIWYSSPAVFADIPTRIYVALRNNTENDLTGTVRFRANEKSIGTAYVSALPGRIVEAWTDWMPTYGEYTVTATLYDVKLSSLGKPSQLVEVESTLAEDVIKVDYDTDKDGVGNETDTDDDNDTLTDEDEIKNGTDPLVATPIPKEEATESKDTSSSPSKDDDSSEATQSLANAQIVEHVAVPNTASLERYIPDGRIDSVVTNVTNKVNETKNTLDTYRVERKEELDAYFGKAAPSTETATSGDTVTITRETTHPTGQGLWVRTLDAGKALIAGLYTFLLWTFSTILKYPAVVELLLLFFIIIVVFKTARGLAKRPKGYN